MYPLDELFGQYIREQEHLGQAEVRIRNCQRCFSWYKKLMAVEDLENFNSEKIIEFVNKLCKIRRWDITKNILVPVKTSVIINSINYLWSFFVWTKQTRDKAESLIDETSSKVIIEKLKFYSIYRKSHNLLLGHLLEEQQKLNTPNNNINSELLIRQLNRRFEYYCRLSSQKFFKGLADYVKYISEKNLLLSVVKDNIIASEPQNIITDNMSAEGITDLAEGFQHSDWGSWFNLEIVYLIIYQMKSMFDKFSGIPEAMNFLNYCYREIRSILYNNSAKKPKYFSYHCYHYDLIRIHNLLMELLENKFEPQEIPLNQSGRITYNYRDYGLFSGELHIQGFNAITFTKNRARVIQFYYLNKDNDSYYSYQDFNEFCGSANKLYSSNEFRLIIDSINYRVKANTAGVIKQLIIKNQTSAKINETNRYRFIK